MNWNPTEVKQGSAIAERIAAFATSRNTPIKTQCVTLSPEDSRQHLDGVFFLNTLPVRHLFKAMGFDEHRPFVWRLEHKLVQALVLQHFCPGSVPITTGLSRYIAEHGACNDENLRLRISSLFQKPALGYGSSEQSAPERRYALEAAFRTARDRVPDGLEQEDWILQEKLSIRREYRVHTIEDRVIPDLTFVARMRRSVRKEEEGPNAYVQSLLACLPDGFVSQTLIGWDIADVGPGEYRVLETNWTGFHPVFGRGFQCSGFLCQRGWGPYVTAKLLRFIEAAYGISIRLHPTTGDKDEVDWFYWWIYQWKNVFRVCNETAGMAAAAEELKSAATFSRTLVDYDDPARVFSEIAAELQRLTATIG